MKKTITLILFVCVVAISGCTSNSAGIIGGEDDPAGIVVSNENNQKETVRLINVNGSLYYDTGEESEITARCGNEDGGAEKAVEPHCIPKEDNTSNFELTLGYQYGINEGEIESAVDGKWIVFKKVSNDDWQDYDYCFKLTGVMPNTDKISTKIVLTDLENITFDEAVRIIFSSDSKDSGKVKTIY